MDEGNLESFREACLGHGLDVGPSRPYHDRVFDLFPGALPRVVATHEVNEKDVGVVGFKNPQGVPPNLYAHAMRIVEAVWRSFPEVDRSDPTLRALSGTFVCARLQGVVDAVVVEAHLDGRLTKDADGWAYEADRSPLPGHR